MEYVVMAAKAVVVFALVSGSMPFIVWAERKVMADAQARIGPNRVGPFGILQSFADALKLIFKEDVVPTGIDKRIFYLAPILSIIPALITFAVVPYGGPDLKLFGYPVGYVADLKDVGILYVFAVTTLGVYGIVLAGWASNNKYSLMGALRSSAQMISYEILLGLSIMGVVIGSGSLSLVEIVQAQATPYFGVIPGIWLFAQPLGFLIFLIASLAEANRVPFDLPEAESELVAGFHTEYSSFKFAMFFMAEYINLLTLSGVITTLFLGGWLGPGVDRFPILGVLYFSVKTVALVYFFIWLRATLPRLRYDQLMRFAWKVMLPAALINIFITAYWVAR
ncbi:MAG: NADH-quinone oxidoreductase subunit NuoH [Armatimonadetes bacterium]|jgi:NADH-quinone oxidoreductase subunit H|nr:NADH-quinone oxidoreductase subunit NuoH [Armatimonadota bacterium]